MSRIADHQAPRPSALDGRSFAIALLALVGAAAFGGLASLVVPGLAGAIYPAAPEPALPAASGAALALVAHNAPVALWPLCLVALGLHEIPIARQLGDGLVVAQLAVHGASVGAAVAAWPELIRWLSHLPAEWSALALPCGLWIAARGGAPPGRRSLALCAGLTLALLALAALLETWAAPA